MGCGLPHGLRIELTTVLPVPAHGSYSAPDFSAPQPVAAPAPAPTRAPAAASGWVEVQAQQKIMRDKRVADMRYDVCGAYDAATDLIFRSCV